MTEPGRTRPRRLLVAALPGLVAAVAGLALLATPRLPLAALGVELLALAFWLWARLGDDRREQLARWGWLRRPALALWLAAALAISLPPPRALAPPSAPGLAAALETPDLTAAPTAGGRDALAPLRVLEALAVLWAGLELLGALPLSRPFPDVTGPLANAGPWLPAILPAMGFLVLWRQSAVWTPAPLVREIAALALLLAAGLAVLRAYTRRSWTASLRWLVVFDSSLAAMLIALDVVPGRIAFLLWCASAGGRLMALAAELRGATTRRGRGLTRWWRLASWTGAASLSWPLLVGVAFAAGRFRPAEYFALAAPVFLATRLTLQRVIEAPERRAIARPDAARVVSLFGAFATLVLGPLALLFAWWSGFEGSFPGVLLALLPAALGGWLRPRRRAGAAMPPVLRVSVAAGATARDFALAVFRTVTSFERRLAATFGAVLRGLGAPARDLHTGDAQEYLLFLVGVGVLALLLPLLR